MCRKGVSVAKHILLVLPHPDFFSQLNGIGGHVAHAIGAVTGWSENGMKVTAVTPPATSVFLEYCSDIVEVLPEHSRMAWNKAMFNKILNTANNIQADIVYLRYAAAFAPWIPLLKRRLGRTHLIIEVNSLLSQRIPLAFLMDRVALRAASDVITISDEEAAVIQRVGGRPMRKKIAVVPNAVDDRRFDPNSLPSAGVPKKKRFRIGYVGVLKAEYGLEVVFDAYQELCRNRNDVELIMCGAGPEEESLKARSKGIPDVVFTGAVPFEEVPNYLRSFDIAVYPATIKHAYQSPVKLLEYMAAGCAIIAASTPSTERQLLSGRLGVLYETGNTVQLVDGLNRLLDDMDKRKSLGELARKQVVAHHTWEIRYRDYIHRLNRIGLL